MLSLIVTVTSRLSETQDMFAIHMHPRSGLTRRTGGWERQRKLCVLLCLAIYLHDAISKLMRITTTI